MKNIIFIIAFIFLELIVAKGQKTITKIIVDSETGMPISGAHVYKSDNLRTGTITNVDGKFVLKQIKENDIVNISHISYLTFTKPVNKIMSDTIKLLKKTFNLDEVIIHAATGKTIMQKVIDSLYSNHFVEPVMYKVYVQVSQFEKDHSELHVLSEYLMNVYQNKKHKSEIQMIKTRAKPFSEAGKKYFKDMRIIPAIAIVSDNIFRFKNDIFKKKKLKNFEIIIEKNNNEKNNLIKLVCKPKKENEYTRIVLFIDKSSYAVCKMIKYYSESEEEFKEIGFKEVNNKWYLDYSNLKIYSDFFSKWKPNSNSTLERKVIYNINDNILYDSKIFKTAFNLVAEPIKYHIGNWSDKFWENYNYIPLPNWIKEKIEESNSR